VGPRDGPGILEKRKISCLSRDPNPGPPSPLPSHSTDYDIPVPAVRNFEVSWEGLKTGKFCKGKVKVKVTLEQATKAQRGSRGTALLLL
jgi:hypothetical protein